MRILSLLILICLMTIFQEIKSPHGSNFRVSCSVCHSTKGWNLDKKVYSFNHDTTSFRLTGQHSLVDCRSCHKSLVFSEAPSACFSCHADVHQLTVGKECGRCHNTGSWLVSDITGIHRNSRFPLLGAHRTADCIMCHKSENPVRFDVTGIECIDCHRKDFMSAKNPDHIKSGYSEDCTTCHDINAFQWHEAGFNHDFFPLASGHSSLTCASCHKTNNYADAKPECSSCHLQDYKSATNPSHSGQNFPLTCTQCHTTNAGWKPAALDHSFFPLTQGHSSLTCASCHKTSNYADAKPECSSCHLQDYNSATNPSHSSQNFPLTCTQCHTTNPGWKPAVFDHSFFPLTQGHSSLTCATCHKTNNYADAKPDCSSCHLGDYNGTTNPIHKNLNFSTTCTECHTTNPGWKPAQYTLHDSQSFPIYSGRHLGVWSSCTDCHNQASNYSIFTCISCHEHSSKTSVDGHHGGVSGYVYSTTSCYTCHRTGRAN